MDPQLPNPQNVSPTPQEKPGGLMGEDQKNLSEFSPQQEFVSSHKRSKKWLIFVIIGVVLMTTVISFVYIVFFGQKKQTTSTTQQSITQPAETPTVSKCLVTTDFDTIYKEVNNVTRPDGAVYDKPEVQFTQSINFNPDSVEYSSPQSQNEGIITAFVDFSEIFPDKEYKFVINGNVSSDKQSEIDLANKRSLKVQNALIAQKVESSRILVTEPKKIGDTNTQSPLAVSLSIDPTCTN